MVNLILTNTLDSQYILNKLKENYSIGSKHLVIVPDRIQMSYERMILEHLNLKGTFNIQVASFSRLADLVLEKKAVTMLNHQTEIMLIRKVIEDNKRDLLYYKTAASHVGFAEELLKIISLIRSNKITVEQLKELVEHLPTKYKNKTEDLLLIYQKYILTMRNGFLDNISKVEALCDSIMYSEYVNYTVYVSEFTEFTTVELNALKELMKVSKNMYISLPFSSTNNSHIYPNSFVSKIENITKEIGVLFKCTSEKEVLPTDFDALSKYLYSYEFIPDGMYKTSNNIEIFNAINPEKEIKNIAIYIKRLIKEKSIRYKDIACICCDVDQYIGIIDLVFKRYNIPYFADVKTKLINQNLAKLLLNAMKVVLNGYMQADVFAYIKECKFLYLEKDIYEFENYCLKYNIDFANRFKNSFVLGDNELVTRMNSFRVQLLEHLSSLEILESVKVHDYVSNIRKFFDNIGAENLCEILAQQQEIRGYKVEAGVSRQIFGKISTILDQIDAILGDCVMDYSQFAKILESAINAVTVSTIPMYIDCVYIGDCSKSRYEKKKYMFVMGASDGVFPKEYGENGLVSSLEYGLWTKNGLSVYPDTRDVNCGQKLNLLLSIIKPTEKLIIGHSLFDLLGDAIQPSRTVSYIKDILGIDEINCIEPDDSWTYEDYSNYLLSRENALEDLVELKSKLETRILKNTKTLTDVMDVLYAMSCEDNGKDYVEKILNGGYELESTITSEGGALLNNRVNVSIFEKYFTCPFKYCVENLLALKPRPLGGVQTKDTGILMHDVMQKFFGLNNWKTIPEMGIYAFVEGEVNTCIDVNRDYDYLLLPENKLTYDNLRFNIAKSIIQLRTKMENTKFEPYMLEAGFGTGNNKFSAIELPTKRKTLKLVGVIDRIDKYENEALIIDYKSKYSIDFNAKDVLYGNRIQLLIYLNTLIKNENITPAGVFYLLVNDKMPKIEDIVNKLKYIGFYNSSSNILKDLDEKVYSGVSLESELYPLKWKINKTKSEIVATKSGTSLTDSKEFNVICEYVMKLVTKAAEELQDGYVGVSPYASTQNAELPHCCEYCDYKAMCNIDNNKTKIRRLSLDRKQSYAKFVE